MWKTIYIAKDILTANNLEKSLREKGIKTILNKLDISKKKDELAGNVEILVLKSEAREAFLVINESLIEENI